MTIDRVTIISLDRTPERFTQFLRLNKGLRVERVAAVDGRTLDRDRCIVEGLITARNRYSAAALGCLSSHVTQWRRCVTEGRPITIAEDDAILRRDFVAAAESALARLPGWDIVLWSWNFDWPLKARLGQGLGSAVIQCNQHELAAEWTMFPKIATPPLLAPLISAAGSSCYTLAPRGARRLLDVCLPAGDQPAPYAPKPEIAWSNTGIDVEMSRHYSSLVAFVALPCLAISLNDHAKSTVVGQA